MSWLKSLCQKLTNRVAESVPDVVLTPNHAFEDAQKKILVDRIKNANKQQEKLGKEYTARLNEYLNTYFNNFSADQKENEFAYDTLNKTWKAYTYKENKSQDILKLKADSFEREVANIVSKNPQFQTK